jgi:hypothetical protein
MPGAEHQVEGEQHRQRDRRGDDQPGAQAAEEREQHRDHQQRALEQVVPHGASTRSTSVGPLVDRRRPDAGRQGLLDLGEPRREPGGHVVAVLADQHEAEAEHDLAAPVGGDRAAPDLVALDHLRDVAHADRRAVDSARITIVLDVARRVMSPTPWTSVASPARSRLPPPTLALLRSSALARSASPGRGRRAPADRRRPGSAARRRPRR